MEPGGKVNMIRYARRVSVLVSLVAMSQAGLAWGQESSADLFARFGPNVLLLEGANGQGETVVQASALALGKGEAMTQCDRLDGVERLAVHQGGRRFLAYPREQDGARNLCRLEVPGLRAETPALVPYEQIRVGQRVYAIGNALGMGLSLSEGIVSGIRQMDGRTWVQTTAALAPGSEGGGLIDDQGRLLGMTDYSKRDGQNINFAVPASFFAEVKQRASAAAGQDAEQARYRAECRRLAEAEDWSALAEVATKWSLAQPDHGEPWSWAGLAQEQMENPKGAVAAYEKLRLMEPGSVTASLALVRNLLHLERAEQALEVLQAAQALNKESADLWFARTVVERELGRAEAMLQALIETLRLDPRHLDALEWSFSIARARKDVETMRQTTSILTEAAPEVAQYWWWRAQTNLLMGRYPQALKALDRADALLPDQADFLITRGSVLALIGAYGHAIEVLSQALEGTPAERAFGYAQLGKAYYEVNLYPEAVAALREAVKLAPDLLGYQYDLGLALKDGNWDKEALEIFQALATKAKEDALPWRQLGMVNAKLGNYQQAVEAMEQSLRLVPGQARVWHALGDTYGKMERFDDVRRAYQKLRDLEPERAEALYRGVLLVQEVQP
jgi:tetratricopeptide (TPR) repeat protein